MTFHEKFILLPPADQAEVIGLMHHALLYRGTKFGNVLTLKTLKKTLDDIAAVFLRNGHEIEVLT